MTKQGTNEAVNFFEISPVTALSVLLLHHVISSSGRTITQTKGPTGPKEATKLTKLPSFQIPNAKSIVDMILPLLRKSQNADARSGHDKQTDKEVINDENDDRFVEILPLNSNIKSKGGKAPLALILATTNEDNRNVNDPDHIKQVNSHYKDSDEENSNVEEHLNEKTIDLIKNDETDITNNSDSESRNNYELEKETDKSDVDILDSEHRLSNNINDTDVVKSNFNKDVIQWADRIKTSSNDVNKSTNENEREDRPFSETEVEESDSLEDDTPLSYKESESAVSRSEENTIWQNVDKELLKIIPGNLRDLTNDYSNEELSENDDLNQISLKVFSRSGNLSESDVNKDDEDSSKEMKPNVETKETLELFQNEFKTNDKNVVNSIETNRAGQTVTKEDCDDNDESKESNNETHKSYNLSFVFSR
ncbi:putative uncharacterized protein DDB_G0282133 [Achroia grisella]|uniref:putative uncharacterized protein DDB_G0282133 n=1 Tax=Achroia grisella TaxID=688607 RepID=UPI0027D1F646|nr:putative uncharacterized protein DDB_G0282133 [Achroia grisella]